MGSLGEPHSYYVDEQLLIFKIEFWKESFYFLVKPDSAVIEGQSSFSLNVQLWGIANKV